MTPDNASAAQRDLPELPEPDFIIDNGSLPCYYEATLKAYGSACAKAARAAALEEARQAVLAEVLHFEGVMGEEDVAYNLAIDHAQNAIRAIAAPGAGKEKPDA